MQISIDFRSDQPIYVQIVEQIRHLIARGELKQGDQLPTVRQLATELRVNFNTVARAYRILDEARIISTQQGRGTYIWEPTSQVDLQKIKQEELASLTNNYLRETQKLGFDPVEVEQEVMEQLNTWKKLQAR